MDFKLDSKPAEKSYLAEQDDVIPSSTRLRHSKSCAVDTILDKEWITDITGTQRALPENVPSVVRKSSHRSVKANPLASHSLSAKESAANVSVTTQ